MIVEQQQYTHNKKKALTNQIGFTKSNQLYFHRVIKVINFAVQLHFLILMIIMVCRENSMPIILIIKIKTANLIIRKRGENNLFIIYHFYHTNIYLFSTNIYILQFLHFTKQNKTNNTYVFLAINPLNFTLDNLIIVPLSFKFSTNIYS